MEIALNNEEKISVIKDIQLKAPNFEEYKSFLESFLLQKYRKILGVNKTSVLRTKIRELNAGNYLSQSELIFKKFQINETLKEIENEYIREFNIDVTLKKDENEQVIDNLPEEIDKELVSISKKEIKTEKKPRTTDISREDKLNYVFENVFLFHDQYNEAYAVIEINLHKETHPIKSKSFKRWLSNFLFEKFKRVPNSNTISDFIRVLEAKACSGEKYELHNRVAWYNNDLYYDLTNEQWQAIKINKFGWEIVKDPPILFRRYQHQKVQVTPEKNGSLNLIDKFFPIKKENDLQLLKVSLITSYIPEIPHIISIAHGSQGSAKSTTHKIIKRLVDPSSVELLASPKDLNQFVQMASHHWCVFLDNLSFISDWLSDALCRLSTGGGLTKRELYSDDEDVIYNFKRCAGLNGINIPATKPDLLDRALLIKHERIEKSQRRTEKDLWSDFEEEKPKILGAVLDILVKAFNLKEKIKLPESPRMADFCIWGETISQAMDYEANSFVRNYFTNIGLQNVEAIENNIIGSIIIKIAEEGFDGTPTELLSKVNSLAPELKLDVHSKGFPKTAQQLTRRLNEIKSNLQDADISIIEGYKGNQRNLRVSKVASVTSVSSITLKNKEPKPSDKGFANDTNNTDDKKPIIVTSILEGVIK